VQNDKLIMASILRELSLIFQRSDANTLTQLEKHLKEVKKKLPSESKEHLPGAATIDVFKIYTHAGANELRNILSEFNDQQLRKLLSSLGFAKSDETRKLAHPELLELVLDKVAARSDQGKAFRQ